MARTSKLVRDAETGYFAPEQKATERLATTVAERIKVGRTKKRK